MKRCYKLLYVCHSNNINFLAAADIKVLSHLPIYNAASYRPCTFTPYTKLFWKMLLLASSSEVLHEYNLYILNCLAHNNVKLNFEA